MMRAAAAPFGLLAQCVSGAERASPGPYLMSLRESRVSEGAGTARGIGGAPYTGAISMRKFYNASAFEVAGILELGDFLFVVQLIRRLTTT